MLKNVQLQEAVIRVFLLSNKNLLRKWSSKCNSWVTHPYNLKGHCDIHHCLTWGSLNHYVVRGTPLCQCCGAYWYTTVVINTQFHVLLCTVYFNRNLGAFTSYVVNIYY
jgi:hypothetical protein